MAAAEREGSSLFVRLGQMCLVWTFFGILVGTGLAPDSGSLGLAAGIIAGLIVLPPLGILLGLCGGCWNHSLAGGLGGHLTGFALAILGSASDLLHESSLALVIGGIMGATLPTVLRPMIKTAQLLSALRPSNLG